MKLLSYFFVFLQYLVSEWYGNYIISSFSSIFIICLVYALRPGAVIGLYLYAELWIGEIKAVIGLSDFSGVIYRFSISCSFFALKDYLENPVII